MSLAFAQSGAAPEGPGPLVQFFPLILIFVVFYFLLILAHSSKRQKRIGPCWVNSNGMTKS